MKKIKLFICLISIVCMMLSVGCSNAKNSRNMKNENSNDDSKVLDSVINNFLQIARIPRPSYHTEKISDWLYDYGISHNFMTIKDDVNNIIMEIPATEGLENLDKVILQTHMDMVFNTNLDLDSTTTPIKVINDGEYLKTDNRTSLGGDDGIGMSIVLTIAEGKVAHGPLRLIFTVDEEVSMEGANKIDSNYINDVKYLINVDYENSDEVAISSAGAGDATFTRKCNLVSPINEKAICIHLYDLLGGHSGEKIGDNRVNGIVAMFNCLNYLYDNGIKYMLAECDNGKARNAIPSDVKICIVVDNENLENAKKLISEYFTNLKNENIDVEKNMKYEITELAAPEKVISMDDSDIVSRLISKIINGVYTMLKSVDGLVESSSNLGIVKSVDGNIDLEAMVRSADKSKMSEINDFDENLAKEYGFNFEVKLNADIWPIKENSKLLQLTKESYKELFNEDIGVVATHIALECGAFVRKNPDIDIVSIGPNIENPHTINERIYIPSIMRTVKLLENILLNINKETFDK